MNDPSPSSALKVISGTNPLRARATVRDLLNSSGLVMPFLVYDPKHTDLSDLPKILPFITIKDIRKEAKEISRLGIRSVKLFAIARHKDRQATEATSADNLCLDAIKAFKDVEPDMCVMTETCICTYTDTGNCVLTTKDDKLDYQRTIETFNQYAILQSEGGADVIGPSAMVDGVIPAIRIALNSNGFRDVSIMPHLIIASSLYNIFRRSVGISHIQHSRLSFQIDPKQPRQAIDQAKSFLHEGADMLLLEPALFILDVVSLVRREVTCPLGAFSVSGEYRLLTGGTIKGITDQDALLAEFYSGARRAGTDLLVTYAAKRIATALQR